MNSFLINNSYSQHADTVAQGTNSQSFHIPCATAPQIVANRYPILLCINMEHFIYIILSLLFGALIYYFSSRRGPEITKDGLLVLTYAKSITWITVFICSVAPIALFLAFLVKLDLKNQSDIVIFVCWNVFWAASGIYLYVRLTKERIIVSQEGIRAVYPFRRDKFIRWSEVYTVTYLHTLKYLVLESVDKHNKIRINKVLTGFSEFCHIAAQHLPMERTGDALEESYNDSLLL